ncbi:glycosyltransferase family 4 protein [Viscerimonas tarda]
MRILWFSVTPSMYVANIVGHNGGGWIASLEQLVRKAPEIQLGIAFEYEDSCFRVEKEQVVYYPINDCFSTKYKLKRKISYDAEEKTLIPKCLKIIEDFKPDVIHVFGSEWCFGLVAQHTDIPVVIHMQGSIPPYYNARFPAGYSKSDYVLYNGLNIKRTISQLREDNFFLLRSKREERILRNCHYYMGRTEWDYNITQLYNPDSQYFYCSEALRDLFVNSDEKWNFHNRNRISIVSTISGSKRKGIDTILKTAKLLKENTNIDFEWLIFGVKDISYHEKKTKIKAEDFNVKLMGVVSAPALKEKLLNADMLIHPSYIDNSPNSVCEAQILGLPVICTNVGGISSLVKHQETGLLFPANDPFTLCAYIKLLVQDSSLASKIGENAREEAINRHNQDVILRDLLAIYHKVKLNAK